MDHEQLWTGKARREEFRVKDVVMLIDSVANLTVTITVRRSTSIDQPVSTYTTSKNPYVPIRFILKPTLTKDVLPDHAYNFQSPHERVETTSEET